jgi:ORF6N domain
MKLTATLIQNKIFEIRGHKVMLDFDLAEMYEVETKRLKESVKRNINRFPADFMFILTQKEFQGLRSQFATSNKRGGTRYMPNAFTEQGVSLPKSLRRRDLK